MTGSTLGLTVSNVALAALLAALPQYARADESHHARAHLSGYQEVPSLSTAGEGRFKAHIDLNNQAIHYELSYEALEGDVTQAHIHFAQRGVNGNIVVFLCTNLGNGPAGTQACPPAPATITGTIRAADVTAGAAAQGIAAGEFAEFVDAIQAGATYANVHTTTRPGGEVRGQLK
jgi:CHRD domain